MLEITPGQLSVFEQAQQVGLDKVLENLSRQIDARHGLKRETTPISDIKVETDDMFGGRFLLVAIDQKGNEDHYVMRLDAEGKLLGFNEGIQLDITQKELVQAMIEEARRP